MTHHTSHKDGQGAAFTLRACTPADHDTLVALAIDTFGPFMTAYEAHVGPVIFADERTDWRGEYERRIPTMHDPVAGKQVVVAEVESTIVGFVGWSYDEATKHGTLELVAVSSAARRLGVASAMCRHAVDDLRSRGAEVVDVGTGGDDFHAPARACYESLGFIAVPVVHYVQQL